MVLYPGSSPVIDIDIAFLACDRDSGNASRLVFFLQSISRQVTFMGRVSHTHTMHAGRSPQATAGSRSALGAPIVWPFLSHTHHSSALDSTIIPRPPMKEVLSIKNLHHSGEPSRRESEGMECPRGAVACRSRSHPVGVSRNPGRRRPRGGLHAPLHVVPLHANMEASLGPKSPSAAAELKLVRVQYRRRNRELRPHIYRGCD